MIKNIIFDVGMVLVDFNWKKVFEELQFSKEDFEVVEQATIRSKLWDEFDRSIKSDEEILEGFIANAPEYGAQIGYFFHNVGRTITCYDYTRKWITELKNSGYHVYILSNYPRRTYQQAIEQLSFVEEADGAVFSFEVGSVKPEPKIYQTLLDKYHLVATESIFIDDKRKNLTAANAFGIATIQFQTREQVIEELKKMGVE